MDEMISYVCFFELVCVLSVFKIKVILKFRELIVF